MSNPQFERGQHLLSTGRADLAERELRGAIASDPNHAAAHALLSFCLAARDDHKGALMAAQRAVALAPDDALPFYALSHAFAAADRGKDAEVAARRALALQPDDPSSSAVVARALMLQKKWAEALEFAEHGLQLDPEDAQCLNARTLCLVQLGRANEADESIGVALLRDPENADTHAGQGYVRLNQGDAQGALVHFREALRLEPGHSFARAGLVEALKARNPIYALFLRYTLWMGRQRTGVVLLLVFGAPIVMRMLRGVARDHPAWQPWIIGLMIVYWGFVLLTWFASPLFDLLLRLHPLGRHALDADQRAGSRAFGLCVLAAALGGTAFGLGYGPGLSLAITAAAAAFPLVGAYGIRVGRARRVAFALTAIVLCSGLGAFALQATGYAKPDVVTEAFTRDDAKTSTAARRPRPADATWNTAVRLAAVEKRPGDPWALIGIGVAILVGVLSTWIVPILSVARPATGRR